MSETITFSAPIRIKSQANLRQHWRKKSCEKQFNLTILKFHTPKSLPKLPVRITLIRISPRFIDDDNLQFAMKEFRDFIADVLIPGLQMGRADNDPRLSWAYDQEKGAPHEYALKIVIESV